MAKTKKTPLSGRRKYVNRDHFYLARRIAGLSVSECAKALDVTPRTIQNYESGRQRIQWSTYLALLSLTGWYLPHPNWTGWVIRNGVLIDPAGIEYTPQDFQGFRYLEIAYQQICERYEKAKAQIERPG